VSVDEAQIRKLVQHGVHAVHLALDDGDKETCLVKEFQYGHLGDNMVHVDFARVDLDEEVTVHVHIAFVGTPHEAQRAEAILRHDMTELAVACKVTEIPEEIKVDLSRMKGTHLTAGEVTLPPRVRLAAPPDAMVASVSFLRHAEEVVGEGAMVEAAAEPEVITAKPDKADADAEK
jgi:large subunit ribosomal protein L25